MNNTNEKTCGQQGNNPMMKNNTNLNFELLNNEKLCNTLKPAFLPKAKYYFLFIGFALGSILSFITLLIEDILLGAPLFTAVTDATNIHHIVTPILLGIIGVFSGMIYNKQTKKQKTTYIAFYESQQTLKQITDNLPSLIAYINSDLHYLFTNKTYTEWFNISPGKIYGKHISELLSKKEYLDILPYVEKAFSGQTISFEGERIYHGNRRHNTKTTLVPHFNNSSEVIGLFALSIDITALRKRENRIKRQKKELQKINATKDKLFSVIAHDLKGPFNSILGFSELLSEEIDSLSKTEIKEITKMLNQQSKDAFNLLSNILDWARTQLKGIKPSPEVIDLNELTNEVIEFIDNIVQMKNIELITKVKNNTHVFADKNLLYSVLRNLISNAIKFTPERGKITIQTNEKENKIEVSVSDTGVGMRPEQLRSIFKPKTENITTRGTNNEQGTGLGLIICKEFIEKNGGKINVTSSIGKGTTFTFTLLRPPKSLDD